jgi:hypothetical protein
MTKIEYTVHLQRGTKVGARSLRMQHVEAVTPSQAIAKAWALNPTLRAGGYRVIRVDHFDDNGHIVID